MDCNEMRARTVEVFKKNKAKSTQQENIAGGQESGF